MQTLHPLDFFCAHRSLHRQLWHMGVMALCYIVCASRITAQEPVPMSGATVSTANRAGQQHADSGDRDLATTLRAAGRYTTFLKIVERAGALPFLGAQSRPASLPASVGTPVQFRASSAGLTQADMDSLMQAAKDSGRLTSPSLQQKLLMAMRKNREGEGRAEAGFMTVFAPTDSAFAVLPAVTRDSLTRDSIACIRFVRAHIVDRGIAGDVLSDVEHMIMLDGSRRAITQTDGALSIDGASIVDGERLARNGYGYGIGGVLRASGGGSAP